MFGPARKTARSALRCAAMTIVLVAMTGCDALMLSPRQKVVRDATRAVCEARDIQAMSPFLTEKSRPMLELATSFIGLGKVLGMNPADAIAKDCKDSEESEMLDEVKVSDTRYIVRSRAKSRGETQETIVVQENGQWRITLF